jgi:hypothetical protein
MLYLYPYTVTRNQHTLKPRVGANQKERWHTGQAAAAEAHVGQLAAGRKIEDILADYPYLKRADIQAFRLCLMQRMRLLLIDMNLTSTRYARGCDCFL